MVMFVLTVLAHFDGSFGLLIFMDHFFNVPENWFVFLAIYEQVISFYFIICLRSLKIKFQNEMLPTVATFQNDVNMTTATTAPVYQPTTMKQ